MAQGTLPITWTWRHNGKDLAQSDDVSYDETGLASTLVLTGLEEEDGGVYQCVAHNENTGAAAASDLLTINSEISNWLLLPCHGIVHRL